MDRVGSSRQGSLELEFWILALRLRQEVVTAVAPPVPAQVGDTKEYPLYLVQGGIKWFAISLFCVTRVSLAAVPYRAVEVDLSGA